MSKISDQTLEELMEVYIETLKLVNPIEKKREVRTSNVKLDEKKS